MKFPKIGQQIIGDYKIASNFTAIFNGKFTVPAADMLGQCMDFSAVEFMKNS